MIREFRAADIEQVMEIWLSGNMDAHGFIAEEYWQENAPAVREQILQAALRVYEADGEILGFAGVQGAYIAGLFVKKGARSQGIGGLLLKRLKREHEALSLNVYKRNRRAEEFYERNGFQITSEAFDEETGERYAVMRWKREKEEGKGQRMDFTTKYNSPLGEILLAADEGGLTGLWFEGQKYFAQGLGQAHEDKMLPVFDETRRWLDLYFSGREPGFIPALHLTGSDFRVRVWKELLTIPYGKTRSYGEIARALQGEDAFSVTAARAVGGAVGHNKISIIIPCHRVIGADGRLTGYAGGIERKIRLLQLEGVQAYRR